MELNTVNVKVNSVKVLRNYDKEIAYQPYQNPSVNRLETDKNKYSWMFDLAR